AGPAKKCGYSFIVVLFIAFSIVCAFPVPSGEEARENKRWPPLNHLQAKVEPRAFPDHLGRPHAVQVMIAARDIGKDEKKKEAIIKLFKEHSKEAQKTDLGLRIHEKVYEKPSWIEYVQGVRGREAMEAFNLKLEDLENDNLRLLRWWWFTEKGAEGYIIYYDLEHGTEPPSKKRRIKRGATA
ncbi:hypothetical protein F5887DRAFT_931968, partial [Amanita rubescens]